MNDISSFSSAGYVLAGGRSRRMGADKAQLPFRGQPLVVYVAAQVEAAAGSVALVGNAKVDGIRTVADLFPDYGPVGGLVTALSDSQADWNLIVACDMPFVTAQWLSELLTSAREADRDALVPVTSDGRMHPLCAVYHRRALKELERKIAAGVHAVRDALKPLTLMHFPVTIERFTANVNTPDEWSAALKAQE